MEMNDEKKMELRDVLINGKDKEITSFKVDRAILSLTSALGPWMIYKGIVNKDPETSHIGGTFLFFYTVAGPKFGLASHESIATYCDVVLEMIEKLKLVNDFDKFKEEFEHMCKVEFYRTKAIFASVDHDKAMKSLHEADDVTNNIMNAGKDEEGDNDD